MGVAKYTPWGFVQYLQKLPAKAGEIHLKQYMSKTASNGGNDSTYELFKDLRWMHEGGVKSAPRMDDLVGRRNVDLALKGQGSGQTFIDIWNFMCRNKELLKKLTLDAYARRKRGDSDTKIKTKHGKAFDLYFNGKSDKAAIEAMIEDRFFGIDCIGFVGNFMVYTGEWPEYIGSKPDNWARDHCKESVNRAEDIRALDFLIFVGQGHIAIVDEVFPMINPTTAEVDICQCSSGEVVGPQLNQWVQLREGKKDGTGRMQYFICHKGSPAMPVDGYVYVMRRKGFSLPGV